MAPWEALQGGCSGESYGDFLVTIEAETACHRASIFDFIRFAVSVNSNFFFIEPSTASLFVIESSELKVITILATASASPMIFSVDLVDFTQGFTVSFIISDVLTTPIIIVMKVVEGG